MAQFATVETALWNAFFATLFQALASTLHTTHDAAVFTTKLPAK